MQQSLQIVAFLQGFSMSTEFERRIFVEFETPAQKELVRAAAAASRVSMSKYIAHFAAVAAENNLATAAVQVNAAADEPADRCSTVEHRQKAAAAPLPAPIRCQERACPFLAIEGLGGLCRRHHEDRNVTKASAYGSSLDSAEAIAARSTSHYKKRTLKKGQRPGSSRAMSEL